MRHSSLVERDYRLEISARVNVVNVEQPFFRLCGSRTLRLKGALNWAGANVSSSSVGHRDTRFPSRRGNSIAFFSGLLGCFFWLGLATA